MEEYKSLEYLAEIKNNNLMTNDDTPFIWKAFAMTFVFWAMSTFTK